MMILFLPSFVPLQMKRILDDDFIRPIFCSTPEELERTGLAEAFSALQYDDDPSLVMQECKQKGTNAFQDGKRNQVHNIQYYRDAVNHCYEALAWANKIKSIENLEAEAKIEASKEQKTKGEGKNTYNDENAKENKT